MKFCTPRLNQTVAQRLGTTKADRKFTSQQLPQSDYSTGPYIGNKGMSSQSMLDPFPHSLLSTIQQFNILFRTIPGGPDA